jgi:hypothetical protein
MIAGKRNLGKAYFSTVITLASLSGQTALVEGNLGESIVDNHVILT